ncbi:MAG: hypothetical protein JXR05_01540 [Flavobacteriaceae bacterium]
MKRILIFFLAINFLACTSKVKTPESIEKFPIEIIDLTSKQLDLMISLKGEQSSKRDSIFINQLYKPNLELWNNYIGNDKDFLKWLNTTAYSELKSYQKVSKEINLKELNAFFQKTLVDMKSLTGFYPKGRWYITFGPKWTDAGGFGNGTMVLDLAHTENTEHHIKLLFPHELNHQIYANTAPNSDKAVLKKIINEGFACYVNYLFHNKKITISEALNYSENEYIACKDSDAELIEFLDKVKNSKDQNTANQLANRGYFVSESLPGAIAYYIGFRVVEEYVKKNGKDSWKNIYTETPEEVLQKSNILSSIKPS